MSMDINQNGWRLVNRIRSAAAETILVFLPVAGELQSNLLLHELKVYGLSLMSLVEISNVQLLEVFRQLVPFVTMK